MKTSRVPATVEDESDEEVVVDIAPPLPITAPSPTAGVGSLTTPFDYAIAFQHLFECLDTISLNVQQIRLDHQEDMHTLTSDFHAYREKQDRRFQKFMAQQSEMFQFMHTHLWTAFTFAIYVLLVSIFS